MFSRRDELRKCREQLIHQSKTGTSHLLRAKMNEINSFPTIPPHHTGGDILVEVKAKCEAENANLKTANAVLTTEATNLKTTVAALTSENTELKKACEKLRTQNEEIRISLAKHTGGTLPAELEGRFLGLDIPVAPHVAPQPPDVGEPEIKDEGPAELSSVYFDLIKRLCNMLLEIKNILEGSDEDKINICIVWVTSFMRDLECYTVESNDDLDDTGDVPDEGGVADQDTGGQEEPKDDEKPATQPDDTGDGTGVPAQDVGKSKRKPKLATVNEAIEKLTDLTNKIVSASLTATDREVLNGFVSETKALLGKLQSGYTQALSQDAFYDTKKAEITALNTKIRSKGGLLSINDRSELGQNATNLLREFGNLLDDVSYDKVYDGKTEQNKLGAMVGGEIFV